MQPIKLDNSDFDDDDDDDVSMVLYIKHNIEHVLAPRRLQSDIQQREITRGERETGRVQEEHLLSIFCFLFFYTVPYDSACIRSVICNACARIS